MFSGSGYFPEGEVGRAKRQVSVDFLKSQLPGAVFLEYKKAFSKYSAAIVKAEAEFKRGARANAEALGENGLVGEAGTAAKESLEQLAGKLRPYFNEGVDSIRGGEFARGVGPVFGAPVRSW